MTYCFPSSVGKVITTFVASAVILVILTTDPTLKGLVPAEQGQPSIDLAPLAGSPREKINPKDGLTYVWIPPGRFRMGRSEGDEEARENEGPAREVEITCGFWLGKTPVTQAAYRKATGQTPSYFKGDDLPVERVSWEEAQAYCKAVGGRLPTEAEWEYAARAGSSAVRYGPLDDIAWHRGNSGDATHPVGQKTANGFGLHDMLGNVWEWTSTDYGSTTKELRGGSWYNDPRYVRVSYRLRGEPTSRYNDIGFRCGGDQIP